MTQLYDVVTPEGINTPMLDFRIMTRILMVILTFTLDLGVLGLKVRMLSLATMPVVWL
jgi:hypothetical protein